MTLGKNLLRPENENGLTQPNVADGAGISLRAYQSYERGLREPQLSVLIALADFYSISLDELVCRKWPKEEEHP